ncbi:MAG TPA: sigma 54-interacting transcriptional regulator [Thermoanaerobaculia bacterium]|nr:sigma 54-interacting transcriptional regulator [Thermoanaerobaculia bacterium]
MTSRALLSDRERELVEAISRLTYGNPFGTERLLWERQALGDEFTPFDVVWHSRGDADNPNLTRIAPKAEELATSLRERLAGARPSREDLGLYRDLVLYVLYGRYQERFFTAIQDPKAGERRATFGFYRDFAEDLRWFQDLPGPRREEPFDAAHLFACFFQIRRAFHFTFRSIVGGSLPAARLRAQVWQSIFTHDLRRYLRALYRSLGDVTTLVTGPSGTGKELVARSIAWSRYIPFDPDSGTFRESWAESFFPLNLSALSPTLIESELFGHRRGAFTGAVSDHSGWLEVCPPLGTVFLDEIGEVEPAIQVKLLRVLETRTFQRLGESQTRRFQGKVLAATNRDLAAEMRAGRFRADLYYRLCSDLLATPSLKERIADSPSELSDLVLALAQRAVGDDLAEELARDVEVWIRANLGLDYPWPGNVRELAQCVNNILIRREYRPAGDGGGAGLRERLAEEFLSGALTADDLLRRYCTLVYLQAGSYEEAARRTGLDRRTVKSRVDPDLLRQLSSI